jgi:hypothetical protein
MSGVEVAILGNSPSPRKFPSLKRNQGRSQSLVKEMLPPHTNTATKPLPSVSKAFFLAVLKDHGQDTVSGDRW